MDMGVDMDMNMEMDTVMDTTFLFRFEPKQNEIRSVSVLFRSFSRTKKNFDMFRCFAIVSKQLATKIGVSKQSETED